MDPADNVSNGTNRRRVDQDSARSAQLLDTDSKEFCQQGLCVLTDRPFTAKYQTYQGEAQARALGDFGEREGAVTFTTHFHSVWNFSRHRGLTAY